MEPELYQLVEMKTREAMVVDSGISQAIRKFENAVQTNIDVRQRGRRKRPVRSISGLAAVSARSAHRGNQWAGGGGLSRSLPATSAARIR